MQIQINPDRVLFARDKKIYGHFLEHFHRQIYGGIYDPESPLSDEDGFRKDVLEALKRISVPIIRWPGGCFVSAYHWEDGVGKNRTPSFNKAWRVEEPNTFGTDEFIRFCRKLACEPYICTNAGTGTAEEMSSWVEYCNLENEGKYAKQRIANGETAPYAVRYWSIGNENYGKWEIGAWKSHEWSLLVEESAKMMSRVDPSIELSAAALTDVNWNVRLLEEAGDRLKWISIHKYWDSIHETNALANYDRCMSYTADLETDISKVRGLLMAFGLDKKIRIAFDEWNLRGWYHPNIHHGLLPVDKSKYLTPRDDNDINSSYTMADAVFSACFLNTLLRNADIVGMANFAPVVNTRGCIYTFDKGIVLRTTYHVFDMYVNMMGDQVIDSQILDLPVMDTYDGLNGPLQVDMIDTVSTVSSATGDICISCINKHPSEMAEVKIAFSKNPISICMTTLSGNSTDDYNDIDHDNVKPYDNSRVISIRENNVSAILPPHSINIITLKM